MTCPFQPESPFDGLDSAYEYLALLVEAADEARQDVEAQIASATGAGAERHKQALQLAAFKIEKLRFHVEASRRISNDLVMLRRLLLAETARGPEETSEEERAKAGDRHRVPGGNLP